MAKSETSRHPPTPYHNLPPLLVSQTQNQQVLILQVIARDRVSIRQDLTGIGQPNLRRRHSTAGVLQNTVTERRNEEIEREVGDADHRSVELQLGFGRVVGELDLQGYRVLQSNNDNQLIML